ncbi:hypothetical protein [Streptomyces sp. NPDC086787]|uniref:hypothetical protein n=1 Tax=Streptomyces sp. NPDC086787 TaxID=3365759 RepID=UPI0038006D80
MGASDTNSDRVSDTAPVTTPVTADSAALARHARFGALPERIRPEDMVADKPALPRDPTGDSYDPAGMWSHYSCVALDLGL